MPQEINVKEWLWRYSRMKRHVRRLQGEYDEIVSVQESVSAVTYDGMPNGSGDIRDLSDLMMVRERMRKNLEAATSNMTKAYLEIMQAISQLDTDLKRSVISLRYVQMKDNYKANTFVDVSNIVGYDKSYVVHVHGEALQDLRVIIATLKKSHQIAPNSTK